MSSSTIVDNQAQHSESEEQPQQQVPLAENQAQLKRVRRIYGDYWVPKSEAKTRSGRTVKAVVRFAEQEWEDDKTDDEDVCMETDSEEIDEEMSESEEQFVADDSEEVSYDEESSEESEPEASFSSSSDDDEDMASEEDEYSYESDSDENGLEELSDSLEIDEAEPVNGPEADDSYEYSYSYRTEDEE